jgi:hypothetical protein
MQYIPDSGTLPGIFPKEALVKNYIFPNQSLVARIPHPRALTKNV